LISPDIVHIQSTNRCNLNCPMCPREFYGLKHQDLGFDSFKSIVDRIPASVKAIDLTGWGEPLLHPKIFGMINYAHKRGFITYLTTNGLLLNREFQKNILESGLDSLTVSLENIKSKYYFGGAHPYSKAVVRNIEDFAQLRKAKKRPLISICVTLHKGKGRGIIEIVKFARRLKLDLVHLARLNTAFRKDLKRTTFKEDMRLWRECLKKKNNKPKILLTEFQYLGLSKTYPLNESCPKIHNYAYVNMQGKLTPCCNLPNYAVGDIMKDDLRDIWRGKNYSYFRANQKKICRKFCNLFVYP